MSIGIFFGSSTGNTEKAADIFKEELGDVVSIVKDIAESSASDMEGLDAYIFGTSTWNDGELQDDWVEFVNDQLDKVDLSGKKVALFGLGDQTGYPEYFVGGMGQLYKEIVSRGAVVQVFWPTDSYEFDESEAVVDGKFCGLPLDEDNEDELTEERIQQFCTLIREEFTL